MTHGIFHSSTAVNIYPTICWLRLDTMSLGESRCGERGAAGLDAHRSEPVARAGFGSAPQGGRPEGASVLPTGGYRPIRKGSILVPPPLLFSAY